MSPGPRERPLLAGTQTLKVVSYNILAPRYANYNSYCPPQFLSWEYRQWLVLRELEHHDADVVALQVRSVLKPSTLVSKPVSLVARCLWALPSTHRHTRIRPSTRCCAVSWRGPASAQRIPALVTAPVQ